MWLADARQLARRREPVEKFVFCNEVDKEQKPQSPDRLSSESIDDQRQRISNLI
jgi:hypothetical protein